MAVESEEIVGHILFTPVTNQSDAGARAAAALGPMAVLPSRQGLGIGSDLVRFGLEACSAEGFRGVFVIGHPWFYPRFSFVPASRYGFRWEEAVPDDVFMALDLVDGAFEGLSGVVRYQPEFKRLG